MTNSVQESANEGDQALCRLLAEQGVDDLKGVEIMRMVRAVNNAYDSILAECLRDAPLTSHRWRVLLRIWMAEQMGQPALNPTHLSKIQQVSKNTISDHLRALEEAGLVEREVDDEDRRQFKIRLTEAGRTTVWQSTPVHVRLLNQLIAGLSAHEIQQIELLLGKLHQTLLQNANTIAKEDFAWPNRDDRPRANGRVSRI